MGAGAAGLSAAFHARRAGLQPLVIDRAQEVGGAWRNMPDTLRCLSPRHYDRLPDGDFPGGPSGRVSDERATRAEVAALLERFQRRHRFRVRSGEQVLSVTTRRAGFELATASGALTTRLLIVATGEFGCPKIPSLPGSFHGVQLHYRNFAPAQIAAGERVLVVGGGNSGADAALAAAARGAQVTLALSAPLQRPTAGAAAMARLLHPLGRVPLRLLPMRGFCTESTPVVGAQLYDAVQRGAVTPAERLVALQPAGGIDSAGRTLLADRIIWCTGFRRETDLVARLLPLAAETGAPPEREGVALGVSGLGFVGLPCMRTRRSGFLRGFSDDAAHVVSRLGEQR